MHLRWNRLAFGTSQAPETGPFLQEVYDCRGPPGKRGRLSFNQDGGLP